MTSDKALLDAIWEQPHDDDLRLVYADWLEEAGGEDNLARSELIRVQIELARLPGDDPRLDDLEARDRELRKTWEKKWWSAMPSGCRKGHFNRGFPVPYLGAFSISGLVRLGAARLRAAPLWRYHYGVVGTDLDALLGWPWLHRLEMFALSGPLPDGWADRLAGCDNLRNAAELNLGGCTISVEELTSLLDGWAGRHLRNLNLGARTGDGDEIAGPLADHPTLGGVRRLSLAPSRITSAGLARLLTSPHLGRLTDLRLENNRFGEGGLQALLAWPGFARLRWLCLASNQFTNAAAIQIARCPASANLRTLLLSWNRIGLAGARALADSPYLDRLQALGVYCNPLWDSPEAVAALWKRFGKRLSDF